MYLTMLFGFHSNAATFHLLVCTLFAVTVLKVLLLHALCPPEQSHPPWGRGRAGGEPAALRPPGRSCSSVSVRPSPRKSPNLCPGPCIARPSSCLLLGLIFQQPYPKTHSLPNKKKRVGENALFVSSFNMKKYFLYKQTCPRGLFIVYPHFTVPLSPGPLCHWVF